MCMCVCGCVCVGFITVLKTMQPHTQSIPIKILWSCEICGWPGYEARLEGQTYYKLSSTGL